MTGVTQHEQASGRMRWRQLAAGAGIGVVVVLANTALEIFGVFHANKLHEIDRLILTLGTPDSQSDDVTLVTIDDGDYRTRFDSKSPLDKGKVIDIIHAIAEFEPAVLGIDVDTVDWQPPIPDINTKETRLVWAVTRNAQGAFALDWAPKPVSEEHSICTAVPIFYPEDDGTIRKQVESITDRGRKVSTFPVALRRSLDSAVWNHGGCVPDEPKGEAGHGMYIRFTGKHHQFTRLAASDVLAAAAPGGHRPQHLVTALRNSVVILGGTYGAARDRYRTPVGDRDGVEILAHAFESLDRPLVELSLAGTAVVEFLVGCVALGLLLIVPLGPYVKAVLALASPFVLAVPVSFIAFHFGSYVSVVGSFAGIPIHHFLQEFLDSRRESREAAARLEQTVRGLKAENEALQTEHVIDQLTISVTNALRQAEADRDPEAR